MSRFINPIVLISAPRSGSTWLFEYIKIHNELYHYISCPAIEPFTQKHFGKSTLSNPYASYVTSSPRRVAHFFSYQQENEISYCGKYFHYELIKHDLMNWFIEYHKEFDIMILRRRDKWKTFLSNYVQHHNKSIVGWHNRGDKVPVDEIRKKIQHKERFFDLDDTISFIDQWIERDKQFSQFSLDNAIELFYEDLTDDTIRNMLDLPQHINCEVHKFTDINYEELLDNYDQIKKIFESTLSY